MAYISKHGLASAKVKGWIYVYMNRRPIEPVYFYNRNDRQTKMANIYMMIEEQFYDNDWTIIIKLDE